MAVLDWLQQLLGGGDPEAAGAAQASTAMQPMTQPWLDKVLSGEMARQGIQGVNDAFASRDPVALAGSFGPSPLGIRAFHGSPHSFDRFDLGKIGTGEGAQAYGHGLYFAESEPVARSYRDALVKPPSNHPLSDNSGTIPDWAANQIRQYPPGHEYYNGVIDKLGDLFKGRIAEQDAQWAAQPWMAESNKQGLQEIVDNLGRMRSGDVTLAPLPKGHMYEVDINAKPEDFLNWDKPLSEQPPQVQAALTPERLGLKPAGPIGERGYYGFVDESGRLIGRAQTQRLPEGVFDPGELGMNVYRGAGSWEPQVATEKLRQAGIPGIRYLDQGSRGAGTGSHNYAIWTPEIVTIMRRYGLLPPLAGGGLLAAPGQGEAAQ